MVTNNSKCLICSKEFYTKPFHKKQGKGKCCSVDCSGKNNRTGRRISCNTCGKSIYRTPSQINKNKSKKYFCNKSCQTIWRNKYFSGSKHPLWRGGVSGVYRKKLINSGRAIRCAMCGEDDFRVMIVHHIDHDKSNDNMDNLAWLCFNCHWLVHKHGELL